MSKIEDKAVDIMDKAMVGAEKLTEKLAQLAEQYGPDVVNAGIEVARFTAAGKLLSGVGYAIVGWALYKTSMWLFAKAKAWAEEDEGHPFAIFSGVGGGVVFLGVIAAFYSALAPFFSIWNWVGLIEPKLWIAHRILEKAL